jgi:hypothetical protein
VVNGPLTTFARPGAAPPGDPGGLFFPYRSTSNADILLSRRAVPGLSV